MIWNDRLRELRIENHMTLKEIAMRLDISEAMASRHETSTKSIPYESIEQYARIYGCTPEYIMGWDKPIQSGNLTEDEVDLLCAYRGLSDEGKVMARSMLNAAKQSARQEKARQPESSRSQDAS